MERKEIEALVRSMRRQGVAEFTYTERKDGGAELNVRFDGGVASFAAPVSMPTPVPVAVAAPTPAAPAAPAAAPRVEGRAIKSPIVGTFYRSASPDAPPYVNVGDRVKKGQIVCIVEAMKLMNQIESDIDGIVTDILVENGQPVQFGHELYRVSQA
jgi:acetyl-CoA carboxylase biotin carboxyl carrier protein